MSSRRQTRLWLRSGQKKVPATVLEDISKEEVVETHKIWHPVRLQGLKQLQSRGQPAPENAHWDWNQKASHLDLLAYRCVGIEYEGRVQGLMMMSTVYPSSRVPNQQGRPTVYVEYIESAPWNLAALTEHPQFSGVGTALIEAAVQYSLREGCEGRLALHSLPQSESFYSRFMTRIGMDNLQGVLLAYFEMTPEQVQDLLGGQNK